MRILQGVANLHGHINNIHLSPLTMPWPMAQRFVFDTVIKSVLLIELEYRRVTERRRNFRNLCTVLKTEIHPIQHWYSSMLILTQVKNRALGSFCVSARWCHITVTKNLDFGLKTAKVYSKLPAHVHRRQWSLCSSLSPGDGGHRITLILSVAGWYTRGTGIFHKWLSTPGQKGQVTSIFSCTCHMGLPNLHGNTGKWN